MSSKSERKQRRREEKRANKERKAQNYSPTTTAAAAVLLKSIQEEANRQNVTERPDGQNHQKRRLAWLLNPSKRVMLIADIVFSGLIAAFAGAQVYYGNKQWNAMADQNNIMIKQMAQTEKTLELMKGDQRPWVGITAVQLKELEVGKRPQCTFELSNSGKTPAQITEAVVYAGVVPKMADVSKLMKQGRDLSVVESQIAAVAPQSTTITAVKTLEPLDQAKWDGIMNGTYVLFFAIREDYSATDGQGKFFTELRVAYDPASTLMLAQYNKMK